jgi:hypothetical protein
MTTLYPEWHSLERGGIWDNCAIAITGRSAWQITKLKRELDRTRIERDILKKAIGIFAEVNRSGIVDF